MCGKKLSKGNNKIMRKRIKKETTQKNQVNLFKKRFSQKFPLFSRTFHNIFKYKQDNHDNDDDLQTSTCTIFVVSSHKQSREPRTFELLSEIIFFFSALLTNLEKRNEL